MTKKTLGKALLSAGIFTTGIAVAGLTFTGDAGLQNIENNLNNMRTEFEQVVEDNTFLKTQFDRLESFYDSSVTKANDTIAGLTAQRDTYFNELNALRNELDNQPTADDDRIEIQAEITRLEGELTKANTKIAELEATAQSIDNETIVDRVNKAEYTAQEVEVATPPLLITPEAMQLDAETATALANTIHTLDYGDHVLNQLEFKSIDVRDGNLEVYFEPVAGDLNSDDLPKELREFLQSLGTITNGMGRTQLNLREQGGKNRTGYLVITYNDKDGEFRLRN